MFEHLVQLYLMRQHGLTGHDDPGVIYFRPDPRGSEEDHTMKIGSYAKAIVAAAAAGTGTLVQAMADNDVVAGEWVTVALAVLGALGITAVIPNAERSDPRPIAGGGDAPGSGWPRAQP